jgi:glycine hydroxymethyltransferase
MSAQSSPSGPQHSVDRAWLPSVAREREASIRSHHAGSTLDDIEAAVHHLIERTRQIHDFQCVNLNPATNIMNPRAEAALACGIGTRPSLGYAGEKYEMGLEAVEEIEVLAADLACQVFDAHYAEVRIGSGAMANLYAFMATCQPGDAIIVPPAAIGGHVTHNTAGAAGLYGLVIHEAPIDASRYTIDVDALSAMADVVRPRLITMGSSLNLMPHPVREVRAVADRVGATVLFDAAHACGMFAGRAWPNPLTHGAHLMTMSTYKSLGGPPGGLLVTNSAKLAARVDAIAYPGLTANFDTSKTASLTIALLDWLAHGPQYAAAMIDNAAALSAGLEHHGIASFHTIAGPTQSHQFALDARPWGDGHQCALRLRDANILASGIGLPISDGMAGLRLGTPEATRLNMGIEDMTELAELIALALTGDPLAVASRTSAFRQRFCGVHFVR